MQKFVNKKEDMVDESLLGFRRCYINTIEKTECLRALKYRGAPVRDKVGIVAGGGWGHDPAFIGYIGQNMLDAVAVGDTFAPPTSDAFAAAFRATDAGKGVVCLCGNFPKDIESAEAAIAQVAPEGITVRTVIANDDVAEADAGKRRGATGEVLLWKVSGAAAASGYDLDQVVRVAKKTIDNMGTIAVGLASCIIPETGRPNYLIERGTMEVGVSHHGLISKDTCKLRTANETADIMLDDILAALSCRRGDEVAVMISGLGNTMLSELYILFNRVYERLENADISIYRAMAGNYFTSLDMMGATLTLLRVDDELKKLLDLPAFPSAFDHFNPGI